MPSRARTVLVTALVAALALWGAACTSGGDDDSSGTTDTTEGSDATEGSDTTEGSEPAELGELEQRVVDALGPQLADQGLEVDALDCPELPVGPGDTARCDAVLSGVEGTITLEGAAPGSPDDLEVTLDPGIISSTLLEGEIEGRGLRDADCGRRAYESVPGDVITCTGTDPDTGEEVTVEATITDGRGGVNMTVG